MLHTINITRNPCAAARREHLSMAGSWNYPDNHSVGPKGARTLFNVLGYAAATNESPAFTPVAGVGFDHQINMTEGAADTACILESNVISTIDFEQKAEIKSFLTKETVDHVVKARLEMFSFDSADVTAAGAAKADTRKFIMNLFIDVDIAPGLALAAVSHLETFNEIGVHWNTIVAHAAMYSRDEKTGVKVGENAASTAMTAPMIVEDGNGGHKCVILHQFTVDVAFKAGLNYAAKAKAVRNVVQLLAKFCTEWCLVNVTVAAVYAFTNYGAPGRIIKYLEDVINANNATPGATRIVDCAALLESVAVDYVVPTGYAKPTDQTWHFAERLTTAAGVNASQAIKAGLKALLTKVGCACVSRDAASVEVAKLKALAAAAVLEKDVAAAVAADAAVVEAITKLVETRAEIARAVYACLVAASTAKKAGRR